MFCDRRPQLAMLTLLLGTTAAPSMAQATAEFETVGAWGIASSLPTISVVSDDGIRWSRVVDTQFKLPIWVDIKAKKGQVTAFVLYQGGAPGSDSQKILTRWVNTKHYQNDVTADASTAKLGTGRFALIGACNKLLDQGKSINEQHQTSEWIDIGITARADQNFLDGTRFKSVNGTAAVKVICEAAPARVTEPPPQRTPVPVTVRHADLAIATLPMQKGKACPVGAFLVARFDADKKGPVDFILRRSDGTSDRIRAENIRQLPNGKWRAEYTRSYKFDHSVERKYMVEVVGQAKASAWKPMRIRCGDMGVGGLTAGVKPTERGERTNGSSKASGTMRLERNGASR